MGEYYLLYVGNALFLCNHSGSSVDDFGCVRAYHVNAEDFVVLASVDYLDDTVPAFVFGYVASAVSK